MDSSIVIEDALMAYWSGESPPPVFFYCLRSTGESERSDPKAILASIVRQLSSLEAGLPLLDPAIKKYMERESSGFAFGALSIEESRTLIIQLIEYYPLTTIIIDALDECDPRTRLELLEVLESILQDSSQLVKIFLSSRDDQDIVWQLKDYPNLEISSDRNKDDIEAFVNTETDRLVAKKRLLYNTSAKEDLRQLIKDKLIAESRGMWVHTMKASMYCGLYD
jgi:hypothetical protein